MHILNEDAIEYHDLVQLRQPKRPWTTHTKP